MIKLTYTELCYTAADFSEAAVEILMQRLGVEEIDVFVHPSVMPYFPNQNMRVGRWFELKRHVRIWPDNSLKDTDEWVARTRHFEVYCEGA